MGPMTAPAYILGSFQEEETGTELKTARVYRHVPGSGELQRDPQGFGGGSPLSIQRALINACVLGNYLRPGKEPSKCLKRSAPVPTSPTGERHSS